MRLTARVHYGNYWHTESVEVADADGIVDALTRWYDSRGAVGTFAPGQPSARRVVANLLTVGLATSGKGLTDHGWVRYTLEEDR